MGSTSLFAETGVSLVQIILLNSVVCGLEICASAAFTYIPPLLLKAGVSERRMSIVLGIGPLFGFLLLPLLGRWSDRCRQFRYGRRRPFIVALSALLIMSLIILPRYPVFGGSYALIIAAILLDFTSQACLTPCEALLVDVSDCVKDESGRLRELCFTVYSVMISAGGCLGYLITAIDWNDTLVSHLFGSQEKSAFSVLAVCFLLLLTITLAIADERPLNLRCNPSNKNKNNNNNGSNINAARLKHKTLKPHASSKKRVKSGSSSHATGDNYSTDSLLASLSSSDDCVGGGVAGGRGEVGVVKSLPSMRGVDFICVESSSEESSGATSDEGEAETDDISADDEYEEITYGLPTFNDPGYESDSYAKTSKYHQLVLTSAKSKGHTLTSILRQYMHRAALICIRHMKFRSIYPRLPKALSRLALANYFSWTAVMSFNLFYTDYVGQVVYKGDPNSVEHSSSRRLYDEGVRAGSWGLLFHCITAAAYGCVICHVTRRIGSRNAYLLGMLSFVVATGVMSQSDNVYIVNAMAACTGFAYATLTSVPFLLATMYHSNKQVYYNDIKDDEVIMKKGVASNLATLDSAYYLSQTILSACMGHLVYYTSSVTSYIGAACISACVASLCVRRIITTPSDMN